MKECCKSFQDKTYMPYKKNGIINISIEIRYCPMCGSKLEEPEKSFEEKLDDKLCKVSNQLSQIEFITYIKKMILNALNDESDIHPSFNINSDFYRGYKSRKEHIKNILLK